jgi:hypothetical protein
VALGEPGVAGVSWLGAADPALSICVISPPMSQFQFCSISPLL